MAKIMNGNRIVTNEVRLSYANVWKPKSINGSDEKYSVSLIIPKSDTETISLINKAIKELNAIKARIPQQTYRTIIGQMRAGDLGGATVGSNRLKKKLAKEDVANENCSRK